MYFKEWGDIIATSFSNIGSGVLAYIPNIIIAVVIFVLGWVLGIFVGKLFEELFRTAKVDSLLRKAGVEEVVNKGGIALNSGKFIGGVVKWFIIAVFLVAAFDILQLQAVNDFLTYIVQNYLPNVIAAIFILFVSAILAEAIQKLVSTSSRAAGLRHANLLGSIAKWAIWVVAVIAALYQLGLAQEIILSLFSGAVGAISLALGLAFGLGGQDAASQYIQKVKTEISDKRAM